MSIVCFEQIKKVLTADSLDPADAGDLPLGPITDANSRTSVYDCMFGYFTFGQDVAVQYDETETYDTLATFTIEGVFTAEAEAAKVSGLAGEENLFTQLVSKYEAIRAKFEAMAKGVAPDDFQLWGTASDPTCMPLPEPLRDMNGQQVFASPVSIELMPGQFPNLVAYRAVLQEVRPPIAKAIVNGTILDDATIAVVCPRPIIQRTPLAGCAGEIVQVQNYQVAEYEVTGSMPRVQVDQEGLSPAMRDLVISLQRGSVDIGVVRRSELATADAPEIDTIWANRDVDEGTGVDITPRDQSFGITVRAKARR